MEEYYEYKALKFEKKIETLKCDLLTLKDNHKYYPELKESFEIQIEDTEIQKQQYLTIKGEIDYQLKDTMLYELLDRFKQDISSYTFE